MQGNIFTTFIWGTCMFSGIFIFGYSIFINNHLLIITSGLNIGLSCTVFVLKLWQNNAENCLMRHIEDYDTEFDYVPGHDYESTAEFLYHNPFGYNSREL